MKKIPLLGTSLLFLCMFGCCTTPVEYPCPSRPELMPVPVDLQIQMPPDAVWIVAENQLTLKRYAAKLEEIAGCQDHR